MVAECRSRIRQGTAVPDLVAWLKASGLWIIPSIQVLVMATGMSLHDAKEAVSMHPEWDTAAKRRFEAKLDLALATVTALQGATPFPDLKAAVTKAIEAGLPRAEVLQAMEESREPARQDHGEPGEDVVLDVMDLLTGWCAPDQRIPGPD